jgi:hypothetical protein
MPLTPEQFGRAYLAAPGQMPADVKEQLALDFQRFLSQMHLPGVTMEKVLGISAPSSGANSMWVEFFMACRNEALVKFSAVICPDGSWPKKADAVRLSIHQYQSIWNRGRKFADPAAHWLLEAFRYASLAGKTPGKEFPDNPDHISEILRQAAKNIGKLRQTKTAA